MASRNQTESSENEGRHYSAIGRFIVAFSHIEFVLKLWIADSVKLPDELRDQIMTHDFALLLLNRPKGSPYRYEGWRRKGFKTDPQ
jgi:hypothetical protein